MHPTERFTVERELFNFRLRLAGDEAGWAAAFEILSEGDVGKIIEIFGTIVSVESLLTFVFPSRHLRPRIADIFAVIRELRALFGQYRPGFRG